MKNLFLVVMLLAAPTVFAGLAEGLQAYEKGDYVTAMKELLGPAQAGNPDAQNKVGTLFNNGQGTRENFAEAAQWYKKSAFQGHAPGQYSYGRVLDYGVGVKEDKPHAKEWYLKAALQGYVPAEAAVGRLYLYESFGLSPDHKEAIKWITKAAEEGDAGSQTRLGNLYETGRAVEKNLSLAATWYRKASERGDESARRALARMVQDGRATAKDEAEAQRLIASLPPPPTVPSSAPKLAFSHDNTIDAANWLRVTCLVIAAWVWYRSRRKQPFSKRRAFYGALGTSIFCTALLAFLVYAEVSLPKTLSDLAWLTLSWLFFILPSALAAFAIAGYWKIGLMWKSEVLAYASVALIPFFLFLFGVRREMDLIAGGIANVANTAVQLAIIGGAIWLVFKLLTRKGSKPSAVKDRPDLLSSSSNVLAAKEAASVRDGVWAGKIENSDLSISVDDRAVVIGPPGTGKTAFLVNQLLRWSESGRPFVCLDIKPEIFGITRAKLQASGYTVYTFNPTSGTGERYNLLADVDGPEAVGELAAALIPADAADNAVFNESARDLLDAVITHLRATVGPQSSLADVRDFVSKYGDWRPMLQSLLSSPDPDARASAAALSTVGKNERLLGSVFATFQSNLRFLRYPKVRNALLRSDFSLKDVCRERTALFLQFEEKHRETTARLWSVMIGHVLRYFIMHTERLPILILLDEIGNAPPVPGLMQKLNTIRSRKMPTWLYFQSKEQMQGYGAKSDEGPSIILGACDFQMVFRLNDNASAQWFSEKIGVVDRVVQHSSVSYEPGLLFSTRSGETFSNELRTEAVIHPHELQQLAVGECICTYRGKAWRGRATPYFESYKEFCGKKPVDVHGARYADQGNRDIEQVTNDEPRGVEPS